MGDSPEWHSLLWTKRPMESDVEEEIDVSRHDKKGTFTAIFKVYCMNFSVSQ